MAIAGGREENRVTIVAGGEAAAIYSVLVGPLSIAIVIQLVEFCYCWHAARCAHVVHGGVVGGIGGDVAIESRAGSVGVWSVVAVAEVVTVVGSVPVNVAP